MKKQQSIKVIKSVTTRIEISNAELIKILTKEFPDLPKDVSVCPLWDDQVENMEGIEIEYSASREE